MTDGVAITAGSGTTILTDDTGATGHAQVVKLAISTDGSATLVPADGTDGLKVNVSGAALTALQLIDDTVFADDAAYTVGTSKVGVVGGVAVAHGANPDAADAADAVAALFNRHRVQFVIGGHPNVVTSSARITTGPTDAAIGPGTIATGTKIVVTRVTVTNSNATTVNVGCKVGFGSTTLPADSTSGAAGILVDHDGIPPGGGFTVGDGSGILGVGGDGEELRWTADTPTSGSLICTVSYYTIES